jgi:hypothetical protein
MPKTPRIEPEHFRQVYERLKSPVSRYDCGRHCAPLNGGEPVCCSTQNAVPVVEKAEWQLLRSRTNMWRRFKPYDAATRRIVDDLPRDCVAVTCRGARHCERDNRSLACRAFPFAPYLTRDGEFIGLAYYWIFEDRCWVISNLQVVDRTFVEEFVSAYEFLFDADPDERKTFHDHSATMRRVFSRWNRAIPLVGRDGGYFKVLPRGRGIVPLDPAKLPKHGPYKSERAYRRAVKEAGGTPPEDAADAR